VISQKTFSQFNLFISAWHHQPSATIDAGWKYLAKWFAFAVVDISRTLVLDMFKNLRKIIRKSRKSVSWSRSCTSSKIMCV